MSGVLALCWMALRSRRRPGGLDWTIIELSLEDIAVSCLCPHLLDTCAFLVCVFFLACFRVSSWFSHWVFGGSTSACGEFSFAWRPGFRWCSPASRRIPGGRSGCAGAGLRPGPSRKINSAFSFRILGLLSNYVYLCCVVMTLQGAKGLRQKADGRLPSG